MLARLGQDQLRLAVRDDGVGLPVAFDIGESSSVGLQLVATLANNSLQRSRSRAKVELRSC